MKIVRLTEALSVSGQIFPDDVGAVAAQGYQVLINNRPDAEDETQPTGSVIAEAAAARRSPTVAAGDNSTACFSPS